MSDKRSGKNHKKNTKERDSLKKIKIQILISGLIFAVMFLSVKIGGKESGFNVFVRKFLFESTNIKQTATGIFNRVNTLIDDEIIPVINNIGVKDD